MKGRTTKRSNRLYRHLADLQTRHRLTHMSKRSFGQFEGPSKEQYHTHARQTEPKGVERKSAAQCSQKRRDSRERTASAT
jgi:hypothetical protein